MAMTASVTVEVSSKMPLLNNIQQFLTNAGVRAIDRISKEIEKKAIDIYKGQRKATGDSAIIASFHTIPALVISGNSIEGWVVAGTPYIRYVEFPHNYRNSIKRFKGYFFMRDSTIWAKESNVAKNIVLEELNRKVM
jgi:hypothetical protein